MAVCVAAQQWLGGFGGVAQGWEVDGWRAHAFARRPVSAAGRDAAGQVGPAAKAAQQEEATPSLPSAMKNNPAQSQMQKGGPILPSS